MKTLLKLSCAAVAMTGMIFASCMDKGDDTDYEELARREEVRVDSLLKVQKTGIKAYIEALSDAADWKEDTLTVPLPRVPGDNPKRGIWYKVVSDADADNTYKYEINTSGTAVIPPVVTLKYKATLLNGTKVQSEDEGTNYSFSALMNTPNERFNWAWVYSFYPKSIKFNGEDKLVGGLTKDGLRKGSKLYVVTPSYWAFDTRPIDKIPTNSPLYYEFEVVDIK